MSQEVISKEIPATFTDLKRALDGFRLQLEQQERIAIPRPEFVFNPPPKFEVEETFETNTESADTTTLSDIRLFEAMDEGYVDHPFSLRKVDNDTIKVFSGTFQDGYPTGMNVDNDPAFTLSVSGSGYVYLQIDYTLSAIGGSEYVPTITGRTVASGASFPSKTVASVIGAPGAVYVMVGVFSGGGTNLQLGEVLTTNLTISDISWYFTP